MGWRGRVPFALACVAAVLSLAMRCTGDKPLPAAPAPGDTPRANSGAATTPEPGADRAPVRRVLGLRCSYASKFLRDRYGLAEGAGCVILRVDNHSGAQEAGLRVGDKIVRLDDTPITSGRQFTWAFEDVPGRARRTFVVERRDQVLRLKVTLGPRADLPADDPYAEYLTARGNSSDRTAVMYYTRALERDPDFDLAYVYRGEIYANGPFTGPATPLLAASDLLKALELDPELAEAHERYAMFLASGRKDVDGAIAHLDRAAALAHCEAPLQSWDLDCGEILLSRSDVYRLRGQGSDMELAAADVQATIDVSGVEQRRQGLWPAPAQNPAHATREGRSCIRDENVSVPCSLILVDKSKANIAADEASVRKILADVPGEPMNEARYQLAQLIANRGGSMDEVIDQLNLAYADARCDTLFLESLCGKYVFARAESYVIRRAAGDVQRATADLQRLIPLRAWGDVAKQALTDMNAGG